jgi:hypothetical protein
VPDDLFTRTLVRASFEGVEFPAGKLETEGGHDGVEHTAYRRPGADVEPTGEKPVRGTIMAHLLNGLPGWGALWPDRLQALLAAIKRHPLGRLQHPTEGLVDAFVSVWKRTTDPEQRSGEVVELHWVEHNASVARLLTATGAAPTDPAATATTQAQAADAAASGTRGYAPVAPRLAATLAYLDAAPRSYPQTLAALASLAAVCTADLALADLAGPDAYATVAALEAARAAVVALRARYLPLAAAQRRYAVPRDMALWEVARECYGDVDQAATLARANAVADWLLVPAGKVLTVPPAE